LFSIPEKMHFQARCFPPRKTPHPLPGGRETSRPDLSPLFALPLAQIIAGRSRTSPDLKWDILYCTDPSFPSFRVSTTFFIDSAMRRSNQVFERRYRFLLHQGNFISVLTVGSLYCFLLSSAREEDLFVQENVFPLFDFERRVRTTNFLNSNEARLRLIFVLFNTFLQFQARHFFLISSKIK